MPRPPVRPSVKSRHHLSIAKRQNEVSPSGFSVEASSIAADLEPRSSWSFWNVRSSAGDEFRFRPLLIWEHVNLMLWAQDEASPSLDNIGRDSGRTYRAG